MSEDKHIDIADDLPKCSACGLPISGMYASFRGNIVPPIAPKLYHMDCVPSVNELMEVLQLARRWKDTERLLHQNLLDGTVMSVPDGTGYSI